MPTLNTSYWRDANRVPITTDGLIAQVSSTMSADNTTATNVLWTVTGTVEIRALWGVVTTALGSNHTAAYWQINDQTATPDITLATGTTLSSAAAGSVIVKKGLAGAALTLLDNSAGRVSEPTTLETTYFSPFLVTKKTGAVTTIDYTYSTTNSPTTGVIQFFCRWLPISEDGAVA